MRNEHKNCYDYVDKAICVGRAHYICPVCKKDISLLHFYWWCAVNEVDISPNPKE